MVHKTAIFGRSWTRIPLVRVQLGVGLQKEGTPAFQNLSPSGFLSHLTALSVP